MFRLVGKIEYPTSDIKLRFLQNGCKMRIRVNFKGLEDEIELDTESYEARRVCKESMRYKHNTISISSSKIQYERGFFKGRVLSKSDKFLTSSKEVCMVQERREYMHISSMKDGNLTDHAIVLNDNEYGFLVYHNLLDPTGYVLESFFTFTNEEMGRFKVITYRATL